jgi:hypothetical protein
VVENDKIEVLWDFMIQCHNMVKQRKPVHLITEKNLSTQDSCLTSLVCVLYFTDVKYRANGFSTSHISLHKEPNF